MLPSLQHRSRVTALSSLCFLAGCAQITPLPGGAPAASKDTAVVVYAAGTGGAPVRDAVVTLTPSQASTAPDPGGAPAVIDLIDKQFEPREIGRAHV